MNHWLTKEGVARSCKRPGVRKVLVTEDGPGTVRITVVLCWWARWLGLATLFYDATRWRAHLDGLVSINYLVDVEMP